MEAGDDLYFLILWRPYTLKELSQYLKSKEIPYVVDEKFLFTCGFVFYWIEDRLACNIPTGSQLTDLTLGDAEKLIKRQIRKVPHSLKKPFWKH